MLHMSQYRDSFENACPTREMLMFPAVLSVAITAARGTR
jgi:hypothetical protein